MNTYQIAAAVVALLCYNVLAVPLSILAGNDTNALAVGQLAAFCGGVAFVDWLEDSGRLRRALAYLDGR